MKQTVKTYNPFFIDGSSESLDILYEELIQFSKKQKARNMSDESKKTIKEAGEFFKKVEEGAKKYQSVPDKQLGDKIKKVGEGAGEVVKHITERTEK